MCAKRERHCPEYEGFLSEAYEEWTNAEELEDVRRSWGRFGGLVTVHRYGREHFRLLARVRWGDRSALVELAARMDKRRRSW